MGANKYRKGIRNSSVNSVNNQADSRNWPRSSESPKVTPGVAGGARDAVGWGGVEQVTARQCMAGQGWIGWGRVYV